jgi:hypothetical protein
VILLGSDLVLGKKKKKKKTKKMICWLINLIKIYGQRNVDIFFNNIYIYIYILRRPEKMSVNSDASRPHPLCYCGVRARLRYSWTSDNPGRKWYGCIKYKVILKLINCDLFFC